MITFIKLYILIKLIKMAQEKLLETIRRVDKDSYDKLVSVAKSKRTEPEEYLAHLIRRLPEDKRLKLMEKYPDLITEEDIQGLESLIENSPEIQKYVRDYQALLSLSLDNETRSALLVNLTRLIYKNLSPEHQRRYTEGNLRYSIPRLNLGPLEVSTSPGSEQDPIPEAVYNIGLMGDKQEVIAELIARTYFGYFSSQETSMEDVDRRFSEFIKKLKNEPE